MSIIVMLSVDPLKKIPLIKLDLVSLSSSKNLYFHE